MIYCILLGRIYRCPEGKGSRGLQGPIRRCPTSPSPPSTDERQPQHRDYPTLFQIVRGFFYVPQNYQHSRNCETGKDCPSFSIRSAEFKQISQIQGIFLMMISLNVKRVRNLETMVSKILNPFSLMFYEVRKF